MRTLPFWIPVTLLGALLAIPSPAAGQQVTVAPEAPRILSESGSVCVCVTLKDTSDPGDPLILRAESFAKVEEEALASLPAASIKTRYRYRYSPVIVLDVLDANALASLTGSALVESIGLDSMGSGALNQSRALIGADDVHALGIKGAGRIAAVIDSGVDTDHPDLKDSIVHQYHFLNGGTDRGSGAEDGHGHGTNVCGIIASRGTVAPRGIAPESKLVAIRVLDSGNRGYISDWTAGVEHAVDLKESGEIDIDSINMSLVSDAQFSGLCDASFRAFSSACDAAREAGIAVFAASGNNSSTTQLTSPACLASTIAVGSVLDTLPNRISTFTSRNAHLDLLAPGETITSTGIGGGTSNFNGTSQACPHAAALACLIREVSPGLSPDGLLKLMRNTGVPILDNPTGLTFPRIDALAAINAARPTSDCNANGISDYIDIQINASSQDADGNGVPDECEAPPGRDFRRGDANDSGGVDLSDAVKTFLYLFAGGSITCVDAADSNDSGNTDISDGIYTLEFLFQGGAAMPTPGPANCGPDPTADGLGCEAQGHCGGG